MEIIAWNHRTTNVHPVERAISIATGSMFVISGLRRGKNGIPHLLAGAAMIGRGVTGRCHMYRLLGVRTAPSAATIPYELGVRARAAITIAQPRSRVFAFWRELENLPRFMRHLVSVKRTEGNRSEWVANAPMGQKVQWSAEIINEIPDELIAWRSLPGSEVDSAGSVRFADAPGERGTEIRVELQYNPPAGVVGAYAARLLGREPGQEIAADLKRLKQHLEADDILTVKGQSRGGEKDKSPAKCPRSKFLEEVIP